MDPESATGFVATGARTGNGKRETSWLRVLFPPDRMPIHHLRNPVRFLYEPRLPSRIMPCSPRDVPGSFCQPPGEDQKSASRPHVTQRVSTSSKAACLQASAVIRDFLARGSAPMSHRSLCAGAESWSIAASARHYPDRADRAHESPRDTRLYRGRSGGGGLEWAATSDMRMSSVFLHVPAVHDSKKLTDFTIPAIRSFRHHGQRRK